MFFYLFLGLIFFFFKKPKLMFTSFACCAALCLFLKENTHGQKMQYAAPSNQPEIKISHFNVNNFEPDIDFTLDYLENLDADVLSIQGLDPEFSFLIEEYLKEEYPYQILLPSLSYNGIAVLSKHHFIADTFYHEAMANILGEVNVKGHEKFYFVASHTVPALTTVDYEQTQAHLNTIASNCRNLDAPLVTFGDYHLVSWSPEIQGFRQSVELNDSRIGFMPSFIDGKVDFWNIPQDHIFYSDHFKCTSFSVLSSPNSPHMGITGTFELQEQTQSLSDNLRRPYVAQ
ncbi:MAG: endonuclease/exonuclease/phosphatase family protein [Bacteroidota bacterium]